MCIRDRFRYLDGHFNYRWSFRQEATRRVNLSLVRRSHRGSITACHHRLGALGPRVCRAFFFYDRGRGSAQPVSDAELGARRPRPRASREETGRGDSLKGKWRTQGLEVCVVVEMWNLHIVLTLRRKTVASQRYHRVCSLVQCQTHGCCSARIGQRPESQGS